MSVAAVRSPSSMPPQAWPVRRFTLAEYRKMCETGVLQEDDRVELLDGWIVPKMTHNPPHDATVQLCQAAVGAILPDDWTLRIQSAISAAQSEPEPDLAIVRGPLRRYADHHPRGDEVGLVIEIAETSLARDRAKLALYAAAGISQCWIVNLTDRQVEAHTGQDPASGAYRSRKIYGPGSSVPWELDGNSIGDVSVDDLLP